MSPEKELPEEISGELTEEEQAALDRELAQMALDAPEMPDDFHARWTEQIRAEAEKNRGSSRRESRRQWRYILSAAAVFVFLIGGTLLTRNSWKDREGVSAAGDNRPAAQEKVNMNTLQAQEEAPAPEKANNAAKDSVLYMAMEEPMDYATEEAAEDAAPMVSMETEEAAPMVSMEAEEAATMGSMEESPAVYAGAAMKDASRAKAAAVPEAEAAAAAAPAEGAPEKTETGKETGEKEEAAPAAQKKEDSWFVAFLKDLWTFTVRMRWVLLGALAAAVIAAAVLNRRNKKSKSIKN